MRSIVIKSRLSLGDVSGAVHEYRLYRRFLALELGIEPPAELASLFDGVAPSRRPRVDVGTPPWSSAAAAHHSESLAEPARVPHPERRSLDRG